MSLRHPTAVAAVALLAALAAAPPSHAAQPTISSQIKSTVPLSSTTISRLQLYQGALAPYSPKRRLQLLAGVPDRYRAFTPLPATSKTGTGISGLRYTIGRTLPTLPAATTGAAVTSATPGELIVCKTVPVSQSKAFGQALFTGGGAGLNSSVIFPGALFKDGDVVNGRFVPQLLPRRPGTILIDVENTGGAIFDSVRNFNDRTQVYTAINDLRTRTTASQALVDIDYEEFAASASQQVSLEVEASMDVNLGSILNLPIAPGGQVGVTLNTATTADNSQNTFVASAVNVFYTISVGGEGPASTIQGPVPNDVLCVTDVQYGRIAYIMVRTTRSREEARLVATELAELVTPAGQISEAGSVSAATQSAFNSRSVSLRILGGNLSAAVEVRNVATLRNYLREVVPTVSGVNGVPIRYVMRYAADNATAFISAVATYQDRQCARADRIKVTLTSLKPTKVDDFGNEELFGKIRIPTRSGFLALNAASELWNVPLSSPVQGTENVEIAVNETVVMHLNELAGPRPDEIAPTFTVKDRIMNDPEYLGASDKAKAEGFVDYRCGACTAPIAEIRNAPNARLARTFVLSEGATAKVEAKMQFELLPLLP